jgi:hypothetical protein
LIKAYYGYRPPYPRKFLPQTPFSPVLKKGHINRILIYEGCFNPPHIAHLNLICYIYSRTRDSLNVVAAVIIPSSDKTCRKKFDDWNDSALLFSRQERKGMWENDPEFPEWACVIDRYWWDDLDDRLLRSAQDDGFNVKFVVACGPDYVNTERVLDYEEEVMVSDTGRAADFMTANGLLNLPGCSPWSLWPTVRPKTREEFSGKPEEYLEGYVATIEGNSDVNASQDYANDYADGLREPRNDNTVRSITIPVTDKGAFPLET